MPKYLKRYLAPLTCFGLLTGFVAASLVGSSSRPIGFGAEGDADRYHWQVRWMVNATPTTAGLWQAENAGVATSAENLQRPNVVHSRIYTNTSTQVQADLLLVQSRDARDMAGHHPLQYYPANGYEIVWSNPRKWIVGDVTLSGVRYQVTAEIEGQTVKRIVDHFLILPNGTITGDLPYVLSQYDDDKLSLFGAAQMQIVTDVSITPTERDQLFVDLVEGYATVIAAIRSGARQ